MTTHLPEAPQRVAELDDDLTSPEFARPRQRGAQVVVLALEAVEPAATVLAGQLRLRSLGKLEVSPCMALSVGRRLAAFAQPLEREITDTLQHLDAQPTVVRPVGRPPNQALVDQRADLLEQLEL